MLWELLPKVHWRHWTEANGRILSHQYESVFSEPKTDFQDLKEHLCPNLSDIEITEESIREAIKDMNVSSAPGPDGVAAFFLKEYVDQLVYPIMKIWRTSLDTALHELSSLQSTKEGKVTACQLQTRRTHKPSDQDL